MQEQDLNQYHQNKNENIEYWSRKSVSYVLVKFDPKYYLNRTSRSSNCKI